MYRLLSFCVTLCAFVVNATAADPTYWQDVRPILRKHCTVCHTERKLDEPDVSAGLALNSPALIKKGGRVPVVVPGKPDESLIVTLLTSKDPKRRMPLDADQLPAADVATLRAWVAAGTPEGVRPADAPAPATRIATRPRLPVTFPTTATLGGGPLALTLPVGPLPPAAAVAFSPDGKLLAVGTYGRVAVWDLAKAEPAKTLTNVLAAVNDVKFSPDGSLLAVAGGQPSARGDLRLFSTKDWKLAHTLGGHADVVSGVAFSPDGSKLVSASFDKTARLWDVKSGAARHTFTGHSDTVYAVAFAPDGGWYATASKDRTARLIDAATGKSKLTLSGMELEVQAVAARPDGKQVVTSGGESQIHWWDAATGERLKKQAGHDGAVHELAFDPAGKLLASAGADKTVRLWNGQTGAGARTVPVGSVVYAVATDPAGKRVAAGSADGLARVFDAATGRPLAALWAGADGWRAVTPEGYAAGAGGVWSAGGKPVDPARLAALAAPEKVAAALRGEKPAAPALK